MIPNHIRLDIISYSRRVDRLLIRRQAIQILEVLLTLARLIENSRYVFLQSYWHRCVFAVEEVLLRYRVDLQNIDIGEIGLRDPSYNLVSIIHDQILHRPPPGFN